MWRPPAPRTPGRKMPRPAQSRPRSQPRARLPATMPWASGPATLPLRALGARGPALVLQHGFLLSADLVVDLSTTNHVRSARSVHRPVLAAPALLRPACLGVAAHLATQRHRPPARREACPSASPEAEQ